eukprot:1814484-Pleurochrysis_carterae.AAC.2
MEVASSPARAWKQTGSAPFVWQPRPEEQPAAAARRDLARKEAARQEALQTKTEQSMHMAKSTPKNGPAQATKGAKPVMRRPSTAPTQRATQIVSEVEEIFLPADQRGWRDSRDAMKLAQHLSKGEGSYRAWVRETTGRAVADPARLEPDIVTGLWTCCRNVHPAAEGCVQGDHCFGDDPIDRARCLDTYAPIPKSLISNNMRQSA